MISRGRSTVTKSEVEEYHSQADILREFLGIDNLPVLINSPLRRDLKPSFSLYSRDGSILYKDFSTGESGDIYSLLEKLWGLPFKDVLVKIQEAFPLHKTAVLPRTTSRAKVYSSDSILKCHIREWRKDDIDYWESYGVSLPWLKFGDVYPISHIIIEKDNDTYAFPAERLAYAYVERKDGIISLKIYQPLSKVHKWSNKHDSSVWVLCTKLPEKGKKLIITSSRKDALCLWENTLIPSCSLQAEGYLPKSHVIDELKSRFENIYLLYDNDFKAEINHGRIFGRRMSEEFGLRQLEIPYEYLSKDPSDLVKNHGRKTLVKVVNDLLTDTLK